MKLRTIAVILLVLAMSFALFGCNNDPAPPPTPSPADAGTTDPVETPEPPADPDEVFIITAAHSHVDTMSLHHFFEVFQEEAERLSDGRLVVNVFPGGQLGGDRDLTEGVQAGDITMMGANINPHAMFMSDFAIFDIQFVHADLESAREVLDDPELLTRVAEIYAEGGFHHLGFTDSAFRYLTANMPIHTPDDMSGLTLRTSANNFHVANWEAIGTNPTPLGIGEVYIALQQGTVDAQDNPIEHNLLFGFYEQQSHFMELNHFFHVNTYVMCPVFYASLPADLQAVVDQAAATAIQATRQFHDNNMASQIQYLLDYGIVFVTLTPEEVALFSERAETTWPLIEAEVTPETFAIFMAAVERAR